MVCLAQGQASGGLGPRRTGVTPGHLGSAAEKSLSLIVVWEALRGIRATSLSSAFSGVPKPLVLASFIHSFVHSLICVMPALDQTGLLLDARNTEKNQMDPALWDHLEYVGVEGRRTNYQQGVRDAQGWGWALLG